MANFGPYWADQPTTNNKLSQVTDLIPVKAIPVPAVRLQDCQPASRAHDGHRQFELVLVKKIQAQYVCFISNKQCMARATAQPP